MCNNNMFVIMKILRRVSLFSALFDGAEFREVSDSKGHAVLSGYCSFLCLPMANGQWPRRPLS